MENTFKNFSGKAINGKKQFEQITNCTFWELDEFLDIIEVNFGTENNVFQMIEKIVTGLQSVKEKIEIKKRKGNDAVVKFKEGGNIVTFWFNNNSITIRVVGDKTFDKEKTINNISQLEEFNVVDIISTKAKVM